MLLFLVVSLADPALGQETSYDPDIAPLLESLPASSLRDLGTVLEQLEIVGGDRMLPLFSALLEGNLYFDATSNQLLIIATDADNQKVAKAVIHENVLGPAPSGLNKIRINNKLRGYLKEAIARLQLNAQDPALRLAAAETLLGKLDPNSIEIVKAAIARETDASVKEALVSALNLFDLKNADSSEARIDAILKLSGNLNPEVRNQINHLLVKNERGDYLETDAEVIKAALKAHNSIDSRIQFYAFIERLFFGLSLGSVLLLAAIGLSITFGVMGVINMAHGEMIMLGAYTTYVVQLLMPNQIEYSLWVAIPAAFVVSGLVGIAIERGVIRFLKGRPLETLLATFGISLILQQAVRSIFSPLNRAVSTPDWMSGSLDINPVLSLTYNRLYILIFALIVFAALQVVLKKTSLGLNVRAVSQNRDMAKAIGIKTEWVDAMTFGLGSGVAGIAGVALSQLTNVGPNLGQSYIIDSFMVVVFGGVGNLLGTLVGGFSLGITNKFLEPATGAVLANILILIFVILFIQKRPKGLFPQKGRAAND